MPLYSSRVQAVAYKIGRAVGGLRGSIRGADTPQTPADLELPGRTHQLFAAGIAEFVDTAWPSRAPWVHHEWSPQSPSILWPRDHAWVMVTEVDYDSTIVAGSTELIDELLSADGIEAFAVGEDVEERLRVYPDEAPHPAEQNP